MSWNEFRNNLLELVRVKLWAQWSALGVGSTAEYRPVTVDLEALLLGTWSFGRTDPRLFDEALSWCCRFGDLVNAKRLDKILGELDAPSTSRVAGAWAETVRAHGSADWKLGIDMRADSSPNESLFYNDEFDNQPRGPHQDAIFEKWEMSRGTFEVRENASSPDFSEPRLVQLAARKLMGAGCRSEVFALLLEDVQATTNELAEMAVYSRRFVQDVLGDLKDAGLLNWNPGRGRTTRPALHKVALRGFRTAVTHGGPTKASDWSFESPDWPGFYLGLHALWEAAFRISRCGFGGFKAQSTLRDALEEAVEFHRRASMRAVYDPGLSAGSLDELVREAQLYIESLLVCG